MNQEELRERQRKRVKRRYYDTLHSLSHSRQLAQQLSDHHKLLLQQPTTAGNADHSDARDQALQRYTDATALADRLRLEKQRLMELVKAREKLQDRLKTLLDENSRENVSPAPLLGDVFLLVAYCGDVGLRPRPTGKTALLSPPSRSGR